MAHVINSGWVDSLPRHLLRSPPLAGVGVSTLVSPTHTQQQTTEQHCMPLCTQYAQPVRKEEEMEGGRRLSGRGNNGLSGERPTQVNIHYKRPSSRLCIWAWRCQPCCYILRHLLPLFQSRTHMHAPLRVARRVYGRGGMSRGRVCISMCVCVCAQIQLSTFMTSSVVLSLS